MALKATQVRNFFGAVFAIALIIVLAAFVCAMFGIRVPGLSAITDFVGFEGGA